MEQEIVRCAGESERLRRLEAIIDLYNLVFEEEHTMLIDKISVLYNRRV